MFLSLIYLPLLLKIFSFLFPQKDRSSYLSKLGHWEYFFSPWRDTLLASGLFIFSLFDFYHAHPVRAFCFFALAILSVLNRLHRYSFRKAFCEWVYKIDNLEPGEFFETYYRGLGSFRRPFPQEARRVSFEKIDYRQGKATRQIFSPLILSAIDTATLAKLAIFAMQNFEGQKGIDMFDAFARIWGARIVQRAQISLECVPSPLRGEGKGEGEKLDGKLLLVFNHKSYLDFALNFFALGALQNKGRHLRPRFIAAKDHFIDNPLFYSWLGVGQCIQKAGMIFINRQEGKGWLAMQEAAQKLTDTDVEVAVYPQGTRAWGLLDSENNRIDAGYYTTFSKKKLTDPRGHLKLGTAQLVLDAALKLREKNESLQVLFIGIDGSATVGPKGSFKIQTESEVFYRLGKLWKVELPDVELENPQGQECSKEAHHNYLATLEAIQGQIDRELEKTTRRHKLLIERFVIDCPENGDQLEQYLEREDAIENNLPFILLDRLYALPHSLWRGYQEALVQLILHPAAPEEWEKLLLDVSLKLLRK
ncbi:MAG: 1-acyl-sn-glycerol-3-phosphate acyltransferase [Deltaproteobacteria bacterium]|nr:1-acyl-sn-glycerol-3-phosphate acyltransferase [Deltaproteobacteria bacterium]